MPAIPRDSRPDSTLALLGDPYRFISRQCGRAGADLFETRLLFQPAICMTGPEAAAFFYTQDRFKRHGAAPARLRKTLFGEGGVQGLDDDAHRQRKQMFLSLMTRERIVSLAETTARHWESSARRWVSQGEVGLYDAVRRLLTRAVCDWAGVPLTASDVARRTRQLTGMFDAAGAVGPLHWWSRLARTQAESWTEEVIIDIRSGRLEPPGHTAAHTIAWYREGGQLLPPRVAAVELLNVLRPTVAVSVYITFIAHALHEFPESRRSLQSGDDDAIDRFVQEVRRFYPFFPAVLALVREEMEWQGYRFPEGRRVLLDLYGTNHDARTWDAPDVFRPERFLGWDGSAFNFVPQGGGDHELNHRCPGEWITIEVMKVALRMLTERMTYDVPQQDLRVNFARLPALPRSRFAIRHVGWNE